MPDTSFTAQQTTILATWLNQVNLAIFQGRSPNVGTTTGSANAQVLTLATGSLYTSRTAGDTFGFIAGYTNAAAATLQVVAPGGSLAAAALELNGAALTGGEVIAGQPYVVAWDGAAWQLISLAGTAFGTSLLQAADAAAGRALLVAAASGANSDITSLALPLQFAGRLTLASDTPVMTTDQTAKTTVYFTPYNGDSIPIYDGTDMVQTTFAELSQATTDTTKSPAAVTTNSNYDLFVWNDSGTIRCTRGPAWSSDTSRGTGAGTTELEWVKGVLVNKVAITNGPAAQRGTYVGSVRSNGSSQIDWKLGSAAAGGGEAFLGVWNMYNRVDVAAAVQDTTDSWTYQSTTVRAMNNSNTNRVSFIRGLDEDGVFAQNSVMTGNSISDVGITAFGLDATNAIASKSSVVDCMVVSSSAQINTSMPSYSGLPGLGFHYLQCVEFCTGSANAVSFFGDSGASYTRQQFSAKARA